FVFSEAMGALRDQDSARFVDCINDYHAELLELSLVAEHTQVLVASLLNRPFIRAAKGCGAMGSDVIALFVAPENREGLRPLLADLNLDVVADSRSMTTGIDIRPLTDGERPTTA